MNTATTAETAAGVVEVGSLDTAETVADTR